MTKINTKSASGYKSRQKGGGGQGLLSHEGVYKCDVVKINETVSQAGNAMLEITLTPSADDAVYTNRRGEKFDDTGVMLKTWLLLEGEYTDKDGNVHEQVEKLWDVLASAGLTDDEINELANDADFDSTAAIEQIGVGPVYVTVRAEEFKDRWTSKVGYFRTEAAYRDDKADDSFRRPLPASARAQHSGVAGPAEAASSKARSAARADVRTTADNLL